MGRTWAVEKIVDLFRKNEFFEFHLLQSNFAEFLMSGSTEKVQTFSDGSSHIIKQKVRFSQASKVHDSMG